MRVVGNNDYPERRDALSRDWQIYLNNIFPDTVLVPLLNDPNCAVESIRELSIEGVILSNGNDWGYFPERDETEKLIVEYCLSSGIPILGVCRGMQVLNILFGGTLELNLVANIKSDHVAVNHQITINSKVFAKMAGCREMMVNSFHNHGILTEGLAQEFRAFATTTNAIVEGFYHPNKPILAVQWHPERKTPSAPYDKQLIQHFFEEGIFWS
jgi:putative glutamine amidotransferase